MKIHYLINRIIVGQKFFTVPFEMRIALIIGKKKLIVPNRKTITNVTSNDIITFPKVTESVCRIFPKAPKNNKRKIQEVINA